MTKPKVILIIVACLAILVSPPLDLMVSLFRSSTGKNVNALLECLAALKKVEE
jgi:hypothetical protein